MTTTHANETMDFEALLPSRPKGRTMGGGTWIDGRQGDLRFQALVFPDHAHDSSWELGGDSRISVLWIKHLATGHVVYNWDRGLDVPAATEEVGALVDFLTAGLADHVTMVWGQ